MNYSIINFNPIGDERGYLVALEQFRDIPFDIKRVYYVFSTKDKVKRGMHAHNNLKQVLVAVSGSFKLLLDDGNDKEVIELKSPAYGVLIDSTLWREMYDFSEDCVLMVLADQLYDPEDYIRDYNEFLNYVKTVS